LEDIGLGNEFLNRAPIPQEIRVRIDKWDWIKLKFLSIKRKITRIKAQPTEARHNSQNRKKKSLPAIQQVKD
jgi:hypothetical protein